MNAASAQRPDFSPFVDGQGNISRPTDFLTSPEWVHIGGWAVVNEDGDDNGFHNVYTTHDVVAHFRQNGVFPDGAVLIKEVRGSTNGQLTTGSVHWAAEPAVWFVSIKDTVGRFPNNPLWGDGWGWALFAAADPSKQIAKDYKSDCLGCHVPVKNRDWMYTYGYSAVLGSKAGAYEVAMSSGEVDGRGSDPEAASMGGSTDATEIDLAASKAAFSSRCASCHSDKVGGKGLGPSLAGLIGRRAGSLEGYRYSDAMKSADVVWTPESLDAYLLDIKGFIPNNKMVPLFPAGVQDAKQRKLIIQYIQSLPSE